MNARFLLPIVCHAFAMLAAIGVFADDRFETGKSVYERQCARCHGAAGEGAAEHYEKPLAGDRAIGELAKLIAETMPEDDPGACVGDDALAVAEYIHREFYSPLAQAKRAPPMLSPSRLTAREQAQTLASLVASFPEPSSSTFLAAPAGDSNRGLSAAYFEGPKLRRDNRKFERVDAQVDFDFADASPDAEKIKPEEFAIRWTGSLLAPVSGEYEMIVSTANGARLWVNDLEAPLIDGWVRSGEASEHRRSIRLLAGHWVPLRLEFFKSKEPAARIALKWKRPGGRDETIDARYLSVRETRPLFVSSTPFPAEDRSQGYERGIAVSKEWDAAATQAAIEAASFIVERIDGFANSRPNDADRVTRLRDFCRRFAETAFRRPLSDDERRFFVDRHFELPPLETIEPPAPEAGQMQAFCDDALKRSLLLVLKSPRFLFRESAERDEPFDRAARLSYALWDAPPDGELLAAAAQGELVSQEQVRQQAKRMLADERTRAKLRQFLHQWLRVDRLDELSKDAALFPEFSSELVADLRTSLDLFLDEVCWSEAADFRELLVADWWMVNGRLAAVYGGELPPEAPFQKVVFDRQTRAGLLSHPLLLSGFAYHATSSPIHRGVFVARSLLGRSLRPPPDAVTPLAPDLHPDLSTRERVALQTSPAACQSCHDMINPLGFTLEHYDAIGRHRDNDRGKPIDAAGSYISQQGEAAAFQGVRPLAEYLAASEETRLALATQLFQHHVKQPLRAYGAEKPEELARRFAEKSYNLQELLVEIAVTAAR